MTTNMCVYSNAMVGVKDFVTYILLTKTTMLGIYLNYHEACWGVGYRKWSYLMVKLFLLNALVFVKLVKTYHIHILQTIHCQTKSTLYGIHCRLWSCQLSSLVCDTLQAVELPAIQVIKNISNHTYIHWWFTTWKFQGVISTLM